MADLVVLVGELIGVEAEGLHVQQQLPHRRALQLEPARRHLHHHLEGGGRLLQQPGRAPQHRPYLAASPAGPPNLRQPAVPRMGRARRGAGGRSAGGRELTWSETGTAGWTSSCLSAASPNRTAEDAALAWTSEVNPHVLNVVATPANETDNEADAFEISRLSCRKICLRSSAGHETFIAASQGLRVQMECRGSSLMSGPVALNFIIEGLDIDAKADAIRRLATIYKDARGPGPQSRRWTSRTLTLRDGLIALDAFQMGGSHRDAARAIYGEEEAARGFSAGDEVMKRRMQRLRQKAIDMMEGEYLSLVA